MIETRFKYPRTPHLPWSESQTDDDRTLADAAHFRGREVVVTEKRDGENTTLYADGHYHARSLDGRGKPYHSWVARMWAERFADLPAGHRVCGENLFARHSIAYDALPSYFEAFAIVDAENRRLDWDEFERRCETLRLRTVPVLYRGAWDEALIRDLWRRIGGDQVEGYVVTTTDGFDVSEFEGRTAKFVRRGHVQAGEHWTKTWVQNRLGGPDDRA